MRELEHKYRKDELSPEELLRLQDLVNSSGDDELSASMHDVWMSGETPFSDIKDIDLDRVKQRIDTQISDKRKHFRITGISAKRIFNAAVVLLFLTLGTSTLYYYRQSSQIEEKSIVIYTGENERANLTLPDGTSIMLNEASRLSYNPRSFNKNSRQITFEGEAYFEVFKDINRTFQIESKGLKVTVLGTAFNLWVRENEQTAELSLKEGCVNFESTMSGDAVILNTGEKTILDQISGKIIVVRSEVDTINDFSWIQGEMIFRDASFYEVLSAIEKSYKMQFVTSEIAIDSEDLFTGTITTKNIGEALEIIELSYNIKAIRKGDVVTLIAE